MTRHKKISLTVTVADNLHLRCNHNLLYCTLELHIHLAKKSGTVVKVKMILSLPLPEICTQFTF